MADQKIIAYQLHLHARAAIHACLLVCAFLPSQDAAFATTADTSNGSDASSVDNSAGSVKNRPAGRVLNGSANDKATVHPSVRLVPPGAEKHILNGTANVKQFNGQAQYSPGSPVYPAREPAHIFVHQTPSRQSFTQLFPARAVFERPHTPYVPPATPKWNYTLTPKNGVMTWAPAYQINHVAQPIHYAVTAPAKRELTASMHGANLSPGPVTSATTGAQRLPGYQSAPPAVAALTATPQLLTQVGSVKEKRAISWDEWYRRVCNVIYKQWILDEVCPGKACVRVTVWSSRDIEARVLSFTPAEGSSRDAYKETGFREISLRAINSLQKTEALDFPANPSRNQVIFDLDMNRSVDGPSGCVVAAFHDIDALPGSTIGKSTRKSISKSSKVKG